MENTNEKTAGQKLQEELTWKFPSVALEAPERVKEAYDSANLTKHFYPRPRQNVNVWQKPKRC